MPIYENRHEVKRTAFGELRVVETDPVMQIDAVSGLRPKTDVETFTDGSSGSVSVVNTGTGNEFKCTTGSSVGGYGIIRSKRFARYQPGQSTTVRISARWPDEGVENSSMRAGAVASGTELSFGYDGTKFGILHRTGGELEAQKLSLSAAASGAETATITLNDTEFTVSLTSGTAAHNCFEIASETFTGYNVYQNDSEVLFVATSIGTQTGTWSFTSDGTAAGTFSETNNGQPATDVWVYQEDWNVDNLDGKGPSTMVLDPTKGNVFEIIYQHGGYGEIRYGVQDPGTGITNVVHRIQYANAFETPNLLLPSMRVGWFAASLGSTTPLAMYGSSAAAFIEGRRVFSFRNPESVDNAKASVGTTLTNIVSIRVRPTLNGGINTRAVDLLFAAVAVDGTKPAEFKVVLNAQLGGEPNWTYQDEDSSTVEYDTAGTTVTIGADSQVLAAGSLSKSGSDRLNLIDYVRMERTETLTLAVAATSGTTDVTGGTTDVTGALTWIEE